MKKLIFTASLVIIALSGCQKESIRPAATSATQSPAPTLHRPPADDAANLDNPYDVVGFNHNVALQQTRQTWRSALVSTDDVYTSVSDYLQNSGLSYSLQSRRAMLPTISVALSDTPNKYQTFIANSNVSTAIKTYSYALNAVVFDSLISSYADFKAAIIVVENQILNDQTLSFPETKTLLESASVIRYSELYWQNEAGAVNTAGSNPVIMRSFWGWLWRVAYVVAADGIGAATAGPGGAIAYSAVTGSVILP